jgi:hypothetical protein
VKLLQITALIVTLFWLVVAIKTALGVMNGTLFVAPDLVGLREKSRNEDIEVGVLCTSR